MARGRGIRKLDTDQQANAIRMFIEGEAAKAIAKKHGVSERTVYNVMDAADIHRCRCGDVHERS